MKTIEYSKDGMAVADHNAEALAREFLTGPHQHWEVSTENAVTAARCLVREGVLPPGDLVFVFHDTKINVTRTGALTDWPAGFCDHNDRWLERLLT